MTSASTSPAATVHPCPPEDRLGLRVVQDIEQPERTKTVNLVLIHGLGGKPVGTWTSSVSKTSKVFFAHLLQQDRDSRFSNIRIYTFGYDANYTNVFAPRNALGMAGFGQKLLDDVNNEYLEKGEVVNDQLTNLTSSDRQYS
jgi:hypothetical protein